MPCMIVGTVPLSLYSARLRFRSPLPKVPRHWIVTASSAHSGEEWRWHPAVIIVSGRRHSDWDGCARCERWRQHKQRDPPGAYRHSHVGGDVRADDPLLHRLARLAGHRGAAVNRPGRRSTPISGTPPRPAARRSSTSGTPASSRSATRPAATQLRSRSLSASTSSTLSTCPRPRPRSCPRHTMTRTRPYAAQRTRSCPACWRTPI